MDLVSILIVIGIGLLISSKFPDWKKGKKIWVSILISVSIYSIPLYIIGEGRTASIGILVILFGGYIGLSALFKDDNKPQ